MTLILRDRFINSAQHIEDIKMVLLLIHNYVCIIILLLLLRLLLLIAMIE